MKARNIRKLKPNQLCQDSNEEPGNPSDDTDDAGQSNTLGLSNIIGVCEKQLAKLHKPGKSDETSAPNLDTKAPVSFDGHRFDGHRFRTPSKRPRLTYEQLEEALEERVNGDRRVKSAKQTASFVERRVSQRRQN